MTSEVTLQASGEEGKPSRFKMVAYSGGILNLGKYPHPVVIDIQGMSIPQDNLPVFTDHTYDIDSTVGTTDSIQAGNDVIVEGLFSSLGDKVAKVKDLLSNATPLQASVGARHKSRDTKFVPENKQVEVNGREFQGPLIVVEKSILDEISFVPFGADRNTSAELITASLYTENLENEMPDQTPVEPKAVETQADEVTLTASVDLTESRKAEAAEAQRVEEIKAACSASDSPVKIEVDGEEVFLKAHAIEHNWTSEKVELEVLRATRPVAPAAHVKGGSDISDEVIQASFLNQMGVQSDYMENEFDEKTLEAASSKNLRTMSLGKLMHESILQAGGHVHPGAKGDELARAYRDCMIQASGYTGHDVGVILENVGHKRAEAAYQLAETTWSQIASTRSVSDFKDHKGYRLTSALKYELMGKESEFKQGAMIADTYTNSVDTYGGTFQLSRQDIINDDLSLFDTLPGQVGREAAHKVEETVYAALEAAGSSFFRISDSTSKKNQSVANSLSSTAFGYDGLAAAETAFMDQINKDGRPISISPARLVVPTALAHDARRLYSSSVILPDSMEGDTNIFSGKYNPVVSRYLNSATTWYLMADPRTEAAFEVAFLNGVQTPTIEQSEASFDILGTKWRFYFDFGVAERSNVAAVKCAA